MLKFKKSKIVKLIVYVIIFLIYIVSITLILFNMGLLSNFATVKFDKSKLTFNASQIELLDINNNKLEHSSNNINKITYSDITKFTIDAFTSIEDKSFFIHKGVNYKRMCSALIKNILYRKYKEGASTISQQLIKNTHLTSEKSIKRKFNELLLTKQLEKNLSKNEIITSYLNAIYFGSGSFGINSASQRYFSKNANELNLTESATLAGIIKSPKKYSPITSPDNCLKRRNLVLKEMLKDKKISQEEYISSIKKPLNLKINKSCLGNNNYYSAVIDEACNILKTTEKDLILKNYKIYTYHDNDLQKIIEDELNNSENLDNKSIDSLAIIIDNKTGGIKAFYGKSDYNLLTIKRQPGSTFKPIISYAPALEENKITNITPILDEKIEFEDYKPTNYNNKYYGWTNIKTALQKSLNIPSIKILEYIGIENAKNFAKRMNVDFDENDAGLSLALGSMTHGIKFLDLTNCYQAIANNGKYIPNRFIKEIKTSTGQTIYKHNTYGIQVMKPSTAYQITDILKGTSENGTSKALRNINTEVASKTGTVGTNNKNKDNTDAWNISYTPTNTTCIWIGSTKMNSYLPKNISGGTIPTLLAQQIYNKQKIIPEKFEMPDDIEECNINIIELEENKKILLASENTPDRFIKKEIFSKENKPIDTSTMFTELEDIKIALLNATENNVKILLESSKHLYYEFIRINEDEKKIICSLNNKHGKIILEDKSAKLNNLYTYYVQAKLPTETQNVSKKSNEIRIFMAQKNPL